MENHQYQPEYRPASRPYGSSFLKLILSWGLALLIAFGVQHFVLQSYRVYGKSMEETLHEGDYLLISKVGATMAGIQNRSYVPERGEIVVLESPGIDGTRLIKRVIGLPGEQVRVRNGTIRVFNDESPRGFDPYEELDLPTKFTEGEATTTVPEGHVYVIGDNRLPGNSLDSRNQLGTVPTENIIGSLLFRVWPPDGQHSF